MKNSTSAFMRFFIAAFGLLLIAALLLGWQILVDLEKKQQTEAINRANYTSQLIAQQIEYALTLSIPLEKLMGVEELFRQRMQSSGDIQGLALLDQTGKIKFRWPALINVKQILQENHTRLAINTNGKKIADLVVIYKVANFWKITATEIALIISVIIVFAWFAAEAGTYRYRIGVLWRHMTLQQAIERIIKLDLSQSLVLPKANRFDPRPHWLTAQLRELLEKKMRLQRLLSSLHATETDSSQRQFLNTLNEKINALGNLSKNITLRQRMVSPSVEARWLLLLAISATYALTILAISHTPYVSWRLGMQAIMLLTQWLTWKVVRQLQLSIVVIVGIATACMASALYLYIQFSQVAWLTWLIVGIAGLCAGIWLVIVTSVQDDAQHRPDMMLSSDNNYFDVIWGWLIGGMSFGIFWALLLDNIVNPTAVEIGIGITTGFAATYILSIKEVESLWHSKLQKSHHKKSFLLNFYTFFQWQHIVITILGNVIGMLLGLFIAVLPILRGKLNMGGLLEIMHILGCSLLIGVVIALILKTFFYRTKKQYQENTSALLMSTTISYLVGSLLTGYCISAFLLPPLDLIGFISSTGILLLVGISTSWLLKFYKPGDSRAN